MDLDEEYRQYDIRDGLIFLIELNDAIFKPLKELDNRSQLVEILTSINELLEQMIITLPSTGVGVYFYNCQTTSKRFHSKSSLNRLFRLSDISASTMKLLNDLIEDDQSGLKLIKDRFPYNSPPKFPLHTIMGEILDEFLQRNSKSSQKFEYNRKRLIWFTTNDKPHQQEGADPEAITQSLRTVIDDFELHKINITPNFLDRFEDSGVVPFDLQFYKDIFLNTDYLKNYNDKSTEIMTKKLARSTLSKKIKSSIIRLKQVNRIQMACNLILSDGDKLHGNLGCSVRGYCLYNHHKAKKFRHIYDKLDEFKLVELESRLSANDQEISLDNNNLDKSVAELKNDANIRSGIQFHDTVFYLNYEQMEFLKTYTFDHDPGFSDDEEDEEDDYFTTANYDNSGTSHANTTAPSEIVNASDGDSDDEIDITFSEPSYLKLLGFRHISKFQPFYNVTPPVFITYDPNDGNKLDYGYKNSAETFKNLYKSCIELERFAILFGCAKKGSMPNLYAFYPTNLAKSSKIGHFPDGFLLVRIPWLDDIRSLPAHILNNDAIKFDKFEAEANPRDIVEEFKAIIEMLTVQNYNPYELPNPSLNFFYKVIKYDLLQLDLEDDFRNLSKNDVTYNYILKIHELVKSNSGLSESVLSINNQLLHHDSIIGKHTLPEAESTLLPAKKPKVIELSEKDILIAWKNHKLNEFTMPQLRQFVGRYKNQIKSAGKKQELIDNITNYLNSRKEAS